MTDTRDDIADDALDLIPYPFNAIAKLTRRLVYLIANKHHERRKRRQAVTQAAGRAANESSKATTRKMKK